MDFLYRYLGLAASLTESLSRKSINFVPLHFVLILACFGAAVFSGNLAREAMGQQDGPLALTPGELFARPMHEGRFVIVSGTLMPEHALHLYRTKKGSKDAADSKNRQLSALFVPVVDARDPKQGVLVRFPGSKKDSLQKGEIRASGQLRAIPSTLRGKLAAEGFQVSGIKIHEAAMLHEGQSPHDPLVVGGMALLAGLVGISLAFVTLIRFTVFRRTTETTTGAAGGSGQARTGQMLASGRFTLEEKSSRRYFVRTPAAVGDFDDGRWGIMANVDASSHFMGFKTVDRSGVWTIAMRPQEITSVERGVQYYGTEQSPALRIQARGESGAQTAVISLATSVEREELYRALRSKAPQSGS